MAIGVCLALALRRFDFPVPASAPPLPTKTLYRQHYAKPLQGDGIHRPFAGIVLHSRYVPPTDRKFFSGSEPRLLANSGGIALEFFARLRSLLAPLHHQCPFPIFNHIPWKHPSRGLTVHKQVPCAGKSWELVRTTLKGSSSIGRFLECATKRTEKERQSRSPCSSWRRSATPSTTEVKKGWQVGTLDFSKLSPNIPPGETFQGLVRLMGERLGMVAEWTGRGADGGRDLIFVETQRGPIKAHPVRWLVSCRDKSESNRAVTERDVGSVSEKVRQHKCDGFLLATTTTASTGLKEMLELMRKCVN